MRYHTFQTIRLLCCGTALALSLSGCGKPEVPLPPPAAQVKGPSPLVRVNSQALTRADFDFEVQRRQEQGRPSESVDALLDELIDREVMLQAARASDWFKDPTVQRELDNQLLSRWLGTTLQREKDQVTVSDEELRQAYEADLDQHTRPALIRLAMLYRKCSPMDSDATRAALTEALEQGKAVFVKNREAALQKGRMVGFGSIAADYSEDATSRYRGGDLGWLDASRADYHWPSNVVATGFALEKGGVSDVLSAEDGLYIVMKSDVRPARVTPFEEAAPALRRRLLRERQDALAEQMRTRLRDAADITVNSTLAAQLELPDPGQTDKPGPVPALRAVSEPAPALAGRRPGLSRIQK